jgi:riboflavin kinase / FMN adenylyltransferase
VQVEEELSPHIPGKDSLVAIGVFDGVHLGHKYLLSQLMCQARLKDLLGIVVTFRQHPEEILSPRTNPPYLTDIDEKVRLLKSENVDAVVALTFTPELAGLAAREFLVLLKKYLRMRGLVVGPDFVLGKSAEANVNTLAVLGLDLDFSVTVVPPKMINGQVRISSTAIRNALEKGDMPKVKSLIGRPFSLNSRVIHGKGRGAGLGFPTANLDTRPGQALPADGVYATMAHIAGHTYPSVTNVGTNPTFGKNDRTVEVFILGHNGNLYDAEIKADFIARLRDEKRFKNADELQAQLARDIERARTILDAEAVMKHG